ncbi:unnamed protein product [Orchesella dallaii]|uniref:Uncharacterized protein n=1 Tax=Orchesella dallaii TaxID=48710 RepID=A0ABP1SB16_9HEXA
MSTKRKSSNWGFNLTSLNPLKWGANSKGKMQVGIEVEDTRKEEQHSYIHNCQKKDETMEKGSTKEELRASAATSIPPPPPPLPPNEPIIFISNNYEPECQSRIQDSFCTLKSTVTPSYEHLSGTQAFIAELKQLLKRMKEKRKERGESGSWFTDSDDDSEADVVTEDEDGEKETIEQRHDNEASCRLMATIMVTPHPKPRKRLESKKDLAMIDNAPLPLPRSASKVA